MAPPFEMAGGVWRLLARNMILWYDVCLLTISNELLVTSWRDYKIIHAESHHVFLCQPSECEQCTCDSDGIARCLVADCAPPPCVNPVYEPGKCCPECKEGELEKNDREQKILLSWKTLEASHIWKRAFSTLDTTLWSCIVDGFCIIGHFILCIQRWVCMHNAIHSPVLVCSICSAAITLTSVARHPPGPNCYVNASRSQVIPAGDPVWVDSCTKCRCHVGQDAGYWEGNRLATCSRLKNCLPEQPSAQQHWLTQRTSCFPKIHVPWWLISCTLSVTKNMQNPSLQLKMSA